MINLFGYANGNGNGLGWLDIPPIIWLIVSLVIIVAAFAVATVLMYLQGDIAKFKMAAAIVIKSPTMAGADKSSEKMPKKVLQLYKRMKRTGQAPVEVIDVMSCVLAPYPKTAASKLALVTFFASMFASIMMIGPALVHTHAMLTGILIVAIVGIVFTIVAVILQIFYYKGALKMYDDYITALSKVMKGSSPGQPQFIPATSDGIGLSQVGGVQGTAIDFSMAPSNAEPFIPQTMDRPSDNAANSIKREQEEMEREVKAAKQAQRAAAQAAAANMGIKLEPDVPIFGDSPVFNEDSLNPTIELEYQQPEFEQPYETSSPAFEQKVDFTAPPPIATPQKTSPVAGGYTPPVGAGVAPPPQGFAAQGAQIRAERTASAASAAQAAAVRTPSAPPPPPSQGITMDAAATEELIRQIEQAQVQGAPLSTCRELTVKLNAAKAQPHNKTPEMTKRLSEAQMKLVRTMSAAMAKK